MRKAFFIILSILILQSAFALPDRFVDALELTAEQEEKIDMLILENETKKEEFNVRLQIKRLELKQILIGADEGTDKSIIKKKLKEIAEIESEMRFITFDQDIEILRILNVEQDKKYKYFRIKRNKENEGRMQEMRERGPDQRENRRSNEDRPRDY